MPFVKLDCGILNSTLWFELEAREVFITALLMAEPYELREPTPQICADSLEYAGWMVPTGWYGFVPAAGIGIIHRARVDEQKGREALAFLSSPEIGSRSREYDGRRLVRIDGGYLVLNYIKYREKDATTAERSRRWRERQKAKELEASTPTVETTRVTETPTRVIRHQAEAEVRVQKQIPDHDPAFETAWESYPISKGKKAARMAWHKLAPSPELQATILASIEAQKATRQWQEGFAPHFSTFLNGERWTDVAEPTPVAAHNKGTIPTYGCDWCEHHPRCETPAHHAIKARMEARRDA